MKTKSIAAAIIFSSLIISPSAYAEETAEENNNISESAPEEAETEQPSPNIDTLPLPSEEIIQQNPWVHSSSAPEGEIPIGQDEPESWAVVDENGNTLNIIVCDIDYCGSGWIPTEYDGTTPTQWARVVLQGSRDSQTGNSNGGHWGQYNFSENVWTETREDGSVYQVPTEYGSRPFCVEGCPVPQDEDIPSENPPVEDLPVEISSGLEEVDVSYRSSDVSVSLNNKTFSFNKKFSNRKNVKGGTVWIVATKNKEKQTWKFKIKKNNNAVITLPTKYLDWKLSINYKLNNNNKVSNMLSVRHN
jgi:hypothetical protein